MNAHMIKYNAFTATKEERELFHSVNMICIRHIHMGMEWRVKQALIHRAQCSMVTESGQLDMIILRNRLMFEADYREYKKSMGL